MFVYVLTFILISSLLHLCSNNNVDLFQLSQYDNNNLILNANTSTIHNMSSMYNNIMYFYYIPSCPHCKTALPLFHQASKYEIASSFMFITINCKHSKHFCKSSNITSYPTITVYYNNTYINAEPSTDIRNILTFISKLTSSPFKNITSSSFNKVSYPFITTSPLNQIQQCIVNSPSYYELNMFYEYNLIHTNAINNESISIQVNPQTIYIEKYNNNCEQIISFLHKHKYSTIKQIDSNYLNLLRTNHKMVLILFLTLPQVNTYYNNITTIALMNNHIVFSYVIMNDMHNDKGIEYLIKYFNVKEHKVPSFVIYDFNKNEYAFISGKEMLNINDIHYKINITSINNIKFYTGEPIHDFFYRLGFGKGVITKKVFQGIILSLIIFFVLLLLFLTLCCHDNDAEQKEKHD